MISLPTSEAPTHGGIVTSQQTPDPSVLPTPASMRTASLIVAVAAQLVGAAAGYLLGLRNPAMHTTQARCVPQGAS